MSKRIEYLKQLFESFQGVLSEKSKEENSQMKWNVLAGGVYWTDEGLDDIHRDLSNAFRFVLNYRTSLLIGKQTDYCKSEYYLAKKYFPNWIGFSENRNSFDSELAERVERIIKIDKYKMDKILKEDES